MSLSNYHLPSSVLCRTITRSTLACRLSRRPSPQYLLPRSSASSPCLYARQQPLTSRRNMSSSPGTTTRSNRLLNAKSPYLLQHADNPVRFALSKASSVRAAWEVLIHFRLIGMNGVRKLSTRPSMRTSPYFCRYALVLGGSLTCSSTHPRMLIRSDTQLVTVRVVY